MRWILLAVSGVLGLVLMLEWLVMRPTPPEIEIRRPAEGSGAPEIAAQELEMGLGSIDEYRVIEQRPLFIEGRRPQEEAVEVAAAPPPAPPPVKRPPPAIDLRGIMILDKQRVALLGRPVEKDGESRLRQGDNIMGWTVAAVEAEKVVLQNGGERTSIPLRKFADVPLPAIPNPTPASKVPAVPGNARPQPAGRNEGKPPPTAAQRR